MSIEEEDAEYAAALAAYREALARLQKAKKPITAREELKREAADRRHQQEHEKRMRQIEAEDDKNRFDYAAIYQKHCDGMPTADIAVQYAKGYSVGDIEFIISRQGRYYR